MFDATLCIYVLKGILHSQCLCVSAMMFIVTSKISL